MKDNEFLTATGAVHYKCILFVLLLPLFNLLLELYCNGLN